MTLHLFDHSIILKDYLSLSHGHACWLGISSLVSEPESRVYMLNITNGVSILDLWDPHAINTSLCASVRLLLQTEMCVSLVINSHNHASANVLHEWHFECPDNYGPSVYSKQPVKRFIVFVMRLLTFDERKQKEVVLMSAWSRSTRCRPLSCVRPRYLPVVIWQSRKGCPQQVCLPLQLRNIKSIVFSFL